MDLIESAFLIRRKNFAGTLQALKSLIDRPSDPEGDIGPISGWRERLSEVHTLPEALELWSWELEQDRDGNFTGLRLEGGGKKFLNDDVLFETIAPFVEKGSFIEMQGEDRSLWRWEFDGEKLVTKEGRVVYD